ncbi:MAG TPA: hypothetical protein PLN25_03690 [Deltaproteobacteria bacterium]|nr:hypothetical protein [Deltaproteobacteria bacterium]HQB37807.1 hypothetical protein [Deltaproteobacteria bacterium]
MASNNPVQRHINSEAVKKVASNLLGMEHFSWCSIALVSGFFLGAGWLPDGITNLLLPGGERIAGGLQLAGALAVFTIFGFLLNNKISEARRVRVVIDTPPSVRKLILFLSAPKKEHLEKLEQGAITEELLDGTNWKMPWLAVKHHDARLEKLYLLTSQGENGSHDCYKSFERIISALLPNVALEEATPLGINFEDVDTVYKVLDELYEKLDQTENLGPEDVILDITGGQKPNSIAGAMATLAEGRRFQYVSTVDERVRRYDLALESNR